MSRALTTVAVAVAGAGRVRLVQATVPAPEPGELILRLRGCGLCGTDLGKIARAPVASARSSPGNDPGAAASPPAESPKLGHEVVGVVEAVGPGGAPFASGERVVVGHHVPCGVCRFCRHEAHSMCPQFRATNLDPCGFSGLIRVPALNVARAAFRVPPHLPDEVAIFTEPLGCALRAVRRSQVQPGDRIAVAGAGTMGLLIAQAIQAAGGHALCLDLRADRLAAARRLGIEATLDGSQVDLTAALRAWTEGGGLDGAILTAVSPALLAALLASLRDGGHLNLFAAPHAAACYAFDLEQIYARELTIRSSYSSTPEELAQALNLLASGAVRADGLVTHRLPFARFDEGVELQRTGHALKVLFYPGEER